MDNVLATDSRDGMICVWDLRVPGGSDDSDGESEERIPMLVVPNAHETGKKPRKSKTKITAMPARGVTSLVFAEWEGNGNGLVSSGSYDGFVSSVLQPLIMKLLLT